MSGKSPSPESGRRSQSPDFGGSSDEEEAAVAEDAVKIQNAVVQKKLWSWLHIAVSTGNIEKVIPPPLEVLVKRGNTACRSKSALMALGGTRPMVAKPQLMLINWTVCVAGCMFILLFSTLFTFSIQRSWTPLMIATLAGYSDIVDYLVVEKNANFRRPNLVKEI